MSRTDDYGLPTERPDSREKTPTVQDRATEIAAHIGVTREAAQNEMTQFRGVAEYETRKLLGQRSALQESKKTDATHVTRHKKVDQKEST
jgi:hypothetical protein